MLRCQHHVRNLLSARRGLASAPGASSASPSPLVVGSGTELDDYKGHAFPWRAPVECRWGDMDALGHLNNAMYFVYFETARCNVWRDSGLDVFRSKSVGPILASTSCAFKRAVVWPDRLTVGLRVSDLDVARGEFTQHYAVYSEEAGRVCAVGDAKIVLVHVAGEHAGRRAEVPQEWLDVFWPQHGAD